MDIKHQYDCTGNHRIIIDGEPGEPSMYEHAAFAKDKEGNWYMAITEYYEGTVPHEMCQGVFKLTSAGEEAKDAVAYNMYRPDEKCPWLDKPDEERACSVGVCPQKAGS